MFTKYFSIGIILSVFALPGQAATIYQQMFSVDDAGWSSNADAPSFTRQQVADEFILTSSASITEIGWIGSYTDRDVNTDGFVVRVYRDNGGLPDLNALLLDIDAPKVVGVDTGFVSPGGRRHIYAWSVTLDQALNLEQATKYWLHIFSTKQLTFAWSRITNPGNFAVRFGTWRVVTNNSDNDLVFALGDPLSTGWYPVAPINPIPIPPAIILFGSGLGLGLVGQFVRCKTKGV